MALCVSLMCNISYIASNLHESTQGVIEYHQKLFIVRGIVRVGVAHLVHQTAIEGALPAQQVLTMGQWKVGSKEYRGQLVLENQKESFIIKGVLSSKEDKPFVWTQKLTINKIHKH